MLADQIAKIVLPEDRYQQNKVLLFDWAMHHDVVEVITGDIATPAKRLIGGGFDDNGVFPEYDNLKSAVEKTPIKDIVKLADLWEAAEFLRVEAIGDHAKEVQRGVVCNVAKMFDTCKANWPSLNWAGVDFVE